MLDVRFEISVHHEILLLFAQLGEELVPDFDSGGVVDFLVFDYEVDAAEDGVVDVAEAVGLGCGQ